MTVFQTTYDKQGDEVLCDLAAAGDRMAEETLIGRYTRMVRMLSRPLFLMGGDSEDPKAVMEAVLASTEKALSMSRQ